MRKQDDLSLITYFKVYAALRLLTYFVGVAVRVITGDTSFYFSIMEDPVFITMVSTIAICETIKRSVMRLENTIKEQGD